MFTPGKLLTLFALSGACCFGALWAQQDERPARARSRGTGAATSDDAVAPVAPVTITTAGVLPQDVLAVDENLTYGYQIATVGARNSKADQALSKAIKLYRDAKEGSAEREQARDKVMESLNLVYDENLASQEKQITELESRLVKLRDQLKRRREAKGKMVDLKLELVLSQADGLGWPENRATDWVHGGEPFGTTVIAPASPAIPVSPRQPSISSGTLPAAAEPTGR